MWISGLEKLAGAESARLPSSLTGARDDYTSHRQTVANPTTKTAQHSKELTTQSFYLQGKAVYMTN